MVRAGHDAWPKAGATELSLGHWEDISGQHTCHPVSSPARSAGSETPFCISALPLDRRAHSRPWFAYL